jgi:mRNA-degrading endonuclease RelE of RelBE toxin-antitoxin system
MNFWPLVSAPADVRERIGKKLREIVTNEWRDLLDFDVKQLQGTGSDIYRTRVVGWRIVFAINEDTETVVIVGGDKRSGAYRNVDTFDERADDYLF